MDFNLEVHIPTGCLPITSIKAMEKDHHGFVDLSVGFPDGTYTPWAVQGSLPLDSGGRSTGLKIWEHTVPTGRWAIGLGVRSQGHFGVVDIILKVCTAPDPLTPLHPTAPLTVNDSETCAAWELVQETLMPDRGGPR